MGLKTQAIFAQAFGSSLQTERKPPLLAALAAGQPPFVAPFAVLVDSSMTMARRFAGSFFALLLLPGLASSTAAEHFLQVTARNRTAGTTEALGLGAEISGHSCGGGMRVRSAGNCVLESQVIGISGSWTDECDACGKNLVEQGLIHSFHCYKYKVVGIPAQMNIQYPCLSNEPVGKDCCSWAGEGGNPQCGSLCGPELNNKCTLDDSFRRCDP